MQKGQGVIFLIVGILVVGLIVAGAYYLGRSSTPKPSPAPAITSQTPQPTPSSSSSLVENCPADNKRPSITLQEAVSIAKISRCSDEGALNFDTANCGISGGNWTFDLTPKNPKSGCKVVCVVNSVNKTGSALWMCTGALPQ